MERCPICKARLKLDRTDCPRCNTDLSQPLRIEHIAKNLCYQSIMQLGAENEGDAVRTVEQSLQLKHDPFALALRDFIRHRCLY
ncbi:MAG: hypothetical protein DRQ49_03400 [Gammaproteobacteria bacterium]|nr:MAG: hypothetical protein DRQ49_03400 [Gammaproteobacteria bacterium]RKZ42248.1 MAG: hypothetical protein DRQ41_07215 [Gammaproteobacteria bacterium]RKZ76740.1 MAG: hypothetical protein DRQ57_02760 [Gammaproteobacteria bacterium]